MEGKLSKVLDFKADDNQVNFIFHQTYLTKQYFQSFQEKIVVENDDNILPVQSLESCPQIIQQFQLASSKRNPFIKETETEPTNLHKDILVSVCEIPGMGEKRSRQLLTKFSSLKKISRATQAEIHPVLGPNFARGVEDFFRKRNSC